MVLKLVTAVAAAAALSATADAAITVYTTQSSFLTALGASGVDTFNNFSTSSPTASPITRAAGAFGYTAAVSTTSFFGAGSGADHWLSTNTATDTISFGSFTGGVSAFGGLFFGTDINGDFDVGDVTLTATDASGTVTQTITNATTSSFVGFVSSGPLLSATISAVQAPAPADPLWPTVNNLTLGTRAAASVAPEPGSWMLMLAGFGVVGAAMRRRRATVRFA